MLEEDREDAEMQTRILLEEAIYEALKLLCKHFSPEECWKIIETSLQKQAADPQVRIAAIQWIQKQL